MQPDRLTETKKKALKAEADRLIRENKNADVRATPQGCCRRAENTAFSASPAAWF